MSLKHSDQVPTNVDATSGNHVAQRFTYATRTTRLAASLAAADVGGVAFQTDNQEAHMLAAAPATWVLLTPCTSAVAAVSAWFVDASAPANGDGRTLGTAFRTAEELSNTLCPNGARYTPLQATTITFASGSYNSLTLNVACSSANTLTIVGNVSSTSGIVLSAVTATNAGSSTRGQLTTLSGTFVAQKRVRVTVGATAGSIAYSTGLNANAQNTFVGPWFNFTGSSTTGPSAADTVVVDTLNTTISRIFIEASSSAAGGGGSGSVIVRDISYNTIFSFGGGVFVTLHGCELQASGASNAEMSAGFTMTNCRNLAGTHTIGAPFTQFNGHAFQGTLSATGGGHYKISSSCVLDAGHISLNSAGVTSQTGVSVMSATADIELENGTGNAIAIGCGCWFRTTSKMWGASTAYALGFTMSSGAWAYCAAAADLSFPVTNAISMTGQTTAAFSSIPFNYARANCGFALNTDASAAKNST